MGQVKTSGFGRSFFVGYRSSKATRGPGLCAWTQGAISGVKTRQAKRGPAALPLHSGLLCFSQVPSVGFRLKKVFQWAENKPLGYKKVSQLLLPGAKWTTHTHLHSRSTPWPLSPEVLQATGHEAVEPELGDWLPVALPWPMKPQQVVFPPASSPALGAFRPSCTALSPKLLISIPHYYKWITECESGHPPHVPGLRWRNPLWDRQTEWPAQSHCQTVSEETHPASSLCMFNKFKRSQWEKPGTSENSEHQPFQVESNSARSRESMAPGVLSCGSSPTLPVCTARTAETCLFFFSLTNCW